MTSRLDQLIEEAVVPVEAKITERLGAWDDRPVHLLVTVRKVSPTDRVRLQPITEVLPAPGSPEPATLPPEGYHTTTTWMTGYDSLEEHTWRWPLTVNDLRNLTASSSQQEALRQVGDWVDRVLEDQLRRILAAVEAAAVTTPMPPPISTASIIQGAGELAWNERVFVAGASVVGELSADTKRAIGGKDAIVELPATVTLSADRLALLISREPKALVRHEAFDLSLGWDRRPGDSGADLRLAERYVLEPSASLTAVAFVGP